ncbi:MAG TPA: RNase H family protein [Pirellulales bacterium]|nr:RNase H family protein [Pirellulales bacterium]
MNIPAPHFLLFSEARGKNRQGQWRFVLQAADGSATFEAADAEPGTMGERLELLAVVRGLEALDQPSRVTLFTPSRYVNRGIAHGLEDWRASDWTWERFGAIVPVKNQDLWRRLDRALAVHRIEFRGWRLDKAHAPTRRGSRSSGIRKSSDVSRARSQLSRVGLTAAECRGLRKDSDVSGAGSELSGTPLPPIGRRRARWHGLNWAAARVRRAAKEGIETWKLRCSQLGTCFLPKPWIG